MPIPPPDESSALPENPPDDSDVGLWQMEYVGTAAELSRLESERQLRTLKFAYGLFLPILYFIWFSASLAVVFLSGFGAFSFDVPAAVEISAFTSLGSGVAIPLGLVARSLFTNQ